MNRFRLEHDIDTFLEYLREIDYPHPWTREGLEGRSVIVRVEDEEEYTKGYVWATWSPYHRRALDFHAASPRRFWLTRADLQKLYVIAEFFGARQLVTLPSGSNELAITAMLTRCGFRGEGAFLVRDL